MAKEVKPFYIIAHNIRSLYNVGSIFRTSDAFGVTKLYLTGYTGTPKNPRLHKTALGAETTVTWEHHKNLTPLLKRMKADGIKLVALENNTKNSVSLTSYKPRSSMALLLGEEISGIDKKFMKFCDKILEIPMRGSKESLNVSVAAGVALHYLTQKKWK